jgi:RimJ/RimL family protein N-acetyltransferase
MYNSLMNKFELTPAPEFQINDMLLARQFDAADADDLLALATDAPVSRYVPWAKWVTDLAGAEHTIDGFNEARVNNIRARYVLEHLGKFAGYIGCWPDDKLGYYEFGFAVLPEYRGKGIGIAAVKSLIELLKIEHGAVGIVAYVDDTNAASQTVVAKLGFTPLEEFDEGDRRYELHLQDS